MADTAGCARPTGASVNNKTAPAESGPAPRKTEEVTVTMAKVGKPAPDFTAPTYHKGTFASVKLSDYLGKWTMLCFYPGDFTFV